MAQTNAIYNRVFAVKAGDDPLDLTGVALIMQAKRRRGPTADTELSTDNGKLTYLGNGRIAMSLFEDDMAALKPSIYRFDMVRVDNSQQSFLFSGKWRIDPGITNDPTPSLPQYGGASANDDDILVEITAEDISVTSTAAAPLILPPGAEGNVVVQGDGELVFSDPNDLLVLSPLGTTRRTLAARAGEVINYLDCFGGNGANTNLQALNEACSHLAAFTKVMIPPGNHDIGDGTITLPTATDWAIEGVPGSSRLTISALGAGGGRLFDLNTASRSKIAGLTLSYATSLAWTNSILRVNGGGDYIFDQIFILNSPDLIVVGDTAAGARIGMSNIYAGSWRADRGGHFIDLRRGSNFDAYRVDMNANIAGPGSGYVRIKPYSGNAFDTWHFQNCAMQNIAGSDTAFEMDATDGNIFNGRVFGGAYDHAIVKGLYLHAGAASTYAIRNNKFIGMRVAMDAGYPVYCDWQSTGNNGDFYDNSMTDPLLVTRDSSEILYVTDASNQTNWRGFPINFGSGQVAVPTGNTPPHSYVRAGAKFYFIGTRLTQANLSAPKAVYAAQTTGDFDYSMQGCEVVATNGTFDHSGSETASANKIITNNPGMTEDTVKATALAAVAAGSAFRQESISVFAYMQLAGLPITGTLKTKYDAFIGALIDSGIWALGNQVHYLMAKAPNETSALLNLYSPGANGLTKNGTGGWTLGAGGYAGNGTDRYLSNGMSPQGLGLTQDNLALFAWCSTDIAANTVFIAGSDGGTQLRINPRTVANKMNSRCNSTTDGAASAAVASSIGGFGIFRSSSGSYIESVNGVETTQSVASTGISTTPLQFLKVGSNFDTRTIAGGSLLPGVGMDGTKRLALFNAYNTWMTT